MARRVVIALLAVLLVTLLLPSLEEPKDLEFTVYATIQGKPKEAEQNEEALFLQALRLSVRNPDEARYLLEEIAISESPFSLEARDISSAIRAAQIEGNAAYTYTLLGQSLAGLGAWELSVEALENAVEIQPNFAEAWAYLGEAYQQNGEDGLPALQTAADLNPLSVSVNLFLALFWQRQGDFEEAFRYLEIAHLRDDLNPQILIEIGKNQALAGKVVEARDYFERAIEIEPNNAILWKSLARYSLENQIFERESGLAAALKALSLNRIDAEAIYLVGRAYWQIGEDEQLAFRFLEAAVDSDPTYAPAHLLLGILHLAKNEEQDAQEHLGLTLEYSSDTKEINQASALLQQFEQ